MIRMSDAPPRRPGLLSRLRADRRGVAFVEFALIAPLMIAFYFGCVQLCLALMADKRSSHAAAAVGDLVAQADRISSTEMGDIFRLSTTALAPFRTDNLRLRVSQVTWDDQTNALRVDWSCARNWAARGPGSTSGVPAGTISRGQSMAFAESEYTYDSPVNDFFPDTSTFRSRIGFRYRKGDQLRAANGADFTNGDCPSQTW